MIPEEDIREPVFDIKSVLVDRPPLGDSKLFSLQGNQLLNVNQPPLQQERAPTGFKRVDTSEYQSLHFKRSDSLMSCE
jgi:hypothetical protein